MRCHSAILTVLPSNPHAQRRKLSHRRPATRTAIAELKRPTAVGSGERLCENASAARVVAKKKFDRRFKVRIADLFFRKFESVTTAVGVPRKRLRLTRRASGSDGAKKARPGSFRPFAALSPPPPPRPPRQFCEGWT